MRRSLQWLAFTAPLLLALVFVVPESLARPGGGNTYSGSSSSRGSSSSSRGSSSSSSSSSRSYSGSGSSYSGSSSSRGSSSGAGGLTFIILVIVVVGLLSVSQQNKREGDWSTSAPPPDRNRTRERGGSARELLTRLRTVGPLGAGGRPVPFDPDFSLVPFEDFLYALYAKAHEARGGGRLDSLAAYLSEGARASLRGLGEPARVQAVVVGAMQYLHTDLVTPHSTRVSVQLRFEANYTETSARGAQQSYYVAEEWTLARGTAVKSRSPDKARVFKCPNCGAALDGMRGNTCAYCEQKVDTGEFDWVVERIEVLEREQRGPQLGGDTPEEGTDWPTVKQPKVDDRMRLLLMQDPELSWDALNQRLGLIFQELQVAWSHRRWEQVRPYVSDSLFQMQLYWMDAYKQAGLRNVTENARITCVELARVVSDKYYYALTVRLFATGLDYTVRDSDGQVVGGSRTRERKYSEYWTLIRGRDTRGKPSADKHCPSCGAALSINMAGNCTHCSAKVTSGEFDWVLSRIEQDESYQG
ncbi:TIM44-like domain-containing protein [Archangium sp.]|jgi:predicted RNA-binding Zn-ribbon protein involved in translation (DUF1610 family)|uniref:TIM44-like domain-containing protein n=1 Tax=Archangium sp. TaxID=1872627 RepID=UPI002ED800E1